MSTGISHKQRPHRGILVGLPSSNDDMTQVDGTIKNHSWQGSRVCGLTDWSVLMLRFPAIAMHCGRGTWTLTSGGSHGKQVLVPHLGRR
jgi:hypothetical protein